MSNVQRYTTKSGVRADFGAESWKTTGPNAKHVEQRAGSAANVAIIVTASVNVTMPSAVLHHTRARQVMHERAGVKWRAQPIAISLLMAEISEGMLRDPDDTARPRLVPRRVRRHICARAISEEP